MTLPNFLVIGTAKAGTDSLCSYLGQHPQVFMSANKEPVFFVAEGRPEIPYRGPGDRETLVRYEMWISSRAAYENLFAAADGAKAIGEGSTWYLYDEGASMRIRRHVPDMKMIAVLRNPADRAYSAFTMMLRDGREATTNFVGALAAEDDRVRAGWEPIWHYRRMGLYHEQLSRYLSLFDRAQIHVVLYEDFTKRPAETMEEIFRFLGVDDSFAPDMSERMNVSLVPEHAAYHRLVKGDGALKSVGRALLPTAIRERVREVLPQPTMKRPAPMPAEARAMLIDQFRDDVHRLEALLERDLAAWLQ